MKTKVVLDTNFLFVPFRFKIDIFEEIPKILQCPCEFYILSGSIEELKRLSEKTIEGKTVENFSKKMIEKGKLKVMKSNEDVDKALMHLSGYVIATGDKELRKKLILLGKPVIYVRAEKKLEVVNFKLKR